MSIATDPPNPNVNTPQPTVEQNLHTAANELPKLAMGVVPQDVLVPFEEMGKHNVWDYQATSGRPTLPPAGELRLSEGEITDSNAWQGFAQMLTESLPEPIQMMLTLVRELPEEARNNASFENYEMWAALDEMIGYCGACMAHFEVMKRLMNSENFETEALLNSELASIVSENMVEQAQEMAELLKKEIEKRERDPAFDAVNYLISQYEPLVQKLAEENTQAHEQTAD
ncbi:MAG: hypothetical protein KDK62_05145 [Chlamydiia bacterium]|nr:hypothetical protein [Chlamydiia bacterium]